MSQTEAILLAAVGPEGAALLRPHFREVALADGDALFREGATSDHLDVVVQGELVVHVDLDDGTIEIGRNGPGAWLGEVGLIDRGPAMATVIANGPALVLRIDHDTLARLQREQPGAAAVLLRHVTRRLAERIAAGSAGMVEEIAPGHYRLKPPEEQRSALARVFGWLLGGAP